MTPDTKERVWVDGEGIIRSGTIAEANFVDGANLVVLHLRSLYGKSCVIAKLPLDPPYRNLLEAGNRITVEGEAFDGGKIIDATRIDPFVGAYESAARFRPIEQYNRVEITGVIKKFNRFGRYKSFWGETLYYGLAVLETPEGTLEAVLPPVEVAQERKYLVPGRTITVNGKVGVVGRHVTRIKADRFWIDHPEVEQIDSTEDASNTGDTVVEMTSSTQSKPKRRSPGTGSVYFDKHSGQWRAEVRLADGHGNRVRRTTSAATREEAVGRIKELRKAATRALAAASSRKPVPVVQVAPEPEPVVVGPVPVVATPAAAPTIDNRRLLKACLEHLDAAELREIISSVMIDAA